MGRFVVGSGVIALVVTALLATPAAQAAPAPGGPGALSHFDLARKDCVGTARNTTLQVWYTVADGVLSDVYEPNVDTTNVETMQFVVTDGTTFTDLQSARHDLHGQRRPDRHGVHGHRTAKRGALPARHRPTSPTRRATRVLMHTRLRGPSRRQLQLYVRLDPTVSGNGGGGTDNGGADSATVDRATRSSPATPTRRPRRPTATTPCRLYVALRADRRSRRPRPATRAPPATASPSSTPPTR